ncbi:MAG: GvpL/GvpF family gas vesicle protein, partial [Nitrospirota bacterium]|nr:GvpL/GvpF family gas vesicle protein [Nitrospirota bacterium]
MSEKLIYIYCVTGEMPEFNSVLEEDGKGVYYIFHKGLFAVVSEALSDEFGEDMLKKNLNDITWLESRVRKHETVIEEVMEQSTVIPFKFATVFKTEDSLKAMVENFVDE